MTDHKKLKQKLSENNMTQNEFKRTGFDELKPCPFCGGEAETSHGLINYELWGVWCPTCKVQIGAIYNSEKQAIERWNTRAERGSSINVLKNLKTGFGITNKRR